MKGREAGWGTTAGALSHGAAAWAQEHLRLILACVAIFGIGLGFGIVFAGAESGREPRPTTIVTVDRGTTVGVGTSPSP